MFKYRLFVPEPLVPGKKYPLLLWLHGAGESGSENINQLFHIQHLFTDPDDLSKYPFFVLVPQCPSGRGWHDGHRIPPEAGESDKGDEPIVIAMKILDDTIRQYPIDVDRIYLLGISSGGSAVWELAMRYPERFAAVAPLASGGGNIEDIARLRDVPVWAFHSEFDSGSTVDAVRDTIQTLQLAGGTAHLTTIPSVHHDCWTAALVDYKVVSWMLWQRQGRYCWNLFGDNYQFPLTTTTFFRFLSLLPLGYYWPPWGPPKNA